MSKELVVSDVEMDAETTLEKPVFSNSRFQVGFANFSMKVSIDRVTVVGNLKKGMDLVLADTIRTMYEVSNVSKGTDRVSCTILDVIRLEYDKMKEKVNRRTTRVEWNPNKLSEENLEWLHDNILSLMYEKEFSRLDVAFDTDIDLSSYRCLMDSSTTKRVFYDRKGKVETQYYGNRTSERMIRIYNKAVEQKKANRTMITHTKPLDEPVVEGEWWRVEFELKRDEWCNKWENVLEGIQVIKPSYYNVPNVNDKVMLAGLLADETLWSELKKTTKSKLKKLMLDYADENITEQLQITLDKTKKIIEDELKYLLEE